MLVSKRKKLWVCNRLWKKAFDKNIANILDKIAKKTWSKQNISEHDKTYLLKINIKYNFVIQV